MSSQRFPARLIFPVEALECASFRAVYEQTRPFGDEAVDPEHGEITFLRPAVPAGRFDSLERLLISVGLPYNLYCETPAESECLHYWRPGMTAPACTGRDLTETPGDPHFILSVRRACQELVYGQGCLAFEPEMESCA